MNLVGSWRVRKQFNEFGWVLGFWGEEILELGKRGLVVRENTDKYSTTVEFVRSLTEF